MINTYLELGKYLDAMDAEATARGEGPEDKSIDKDFRSGVQLGVGASNLILSLMPNRLLAVAEIFGYTGDRDAGLKRLMKAGGWVKGSSEPLVGVGDLRPSNSLAQTAFADLMGQTMKVFEDLWSTFACFASISSSRASRSEASTFQWHKRYSNGT